MKAAAALSALLLSLQIGSAAAADAMVPPGYAPDMKTVEGGLWRSVSQIESEFSTSPLLVRDEAVNAYVKKVACKLLSEYCASLRYYVLDTPEFNASAYPNGMIVVNTGLLLRMENEAQFAAVLGHELTHYLNRHTLNRMESVRDTSNAFAFFGLGMAGLGVGFRVDTRSITDLVGMIARGALLQYTRDQEAEADDHGVRFGVKAGYDPHQAELIWKDVEDEEAANPRRRSSSGGDHPDNLVRMKSIAKLAASLPESSSAAMIGTDEFRSVFTPLRGRWLEEELNTAQYDKSLQMIGRLIAADPSDAVLRFYRGEAYRRRNGKGDLQQALSAYKEAVAMTDVPPAAYRGLGLAALKSGDKAAAHTAFTQYLAAIPAADDRAMIEMYLSNSEQ